MSTLEELLLPVEGDKPAGANLQYTPAFAELERVAAGKPERQVGAVVAAAEPPDWQSVLTQCRALLKSTKDLRVANYLVRASLGVDGFVGLADSLRLVSGLIDRYWAELYPRLDAEDDNDPTFRVNAMAALTHREVLQAIRATPLVRAKGLGTVTLRDLEASASGQAAPADGVAIEAVFQEVPVTELAAASQVVDECSENARALAEAWASRLDGAGPDFTELRRLLTQASDVLKARLRQRQPVQNGSSADRGGARAPTAFGSTPSVAGGDIRSRDDVIRALDGICAYYARYEPSSPVPLLLERCKRLVTMSFLDIVKEMLPEGSSTIQTIVGKPKE